MKKNSFFKKVFAVVAALLLLGVSNAYAQEERNLLGLAMSKDGWKGDILEPTAIFPDKQMIKAQLGDLSPQMREDIRAKGELAKEYNWPVIPVSSYLDFVRTGDRTRMQGFRNERVGHLKQLVLAELAAQEGEYIDAIIDGTWAICEQSTWAMSAHLTIQKYGSGVPDINDPIIDLGVGEVANLLSWVYFYFRSELESVSPLLALRIEQEISERVIEPYLAREDFWWMGFESSFVNNWNPWCNYNVLMSAIMVERDKEKQLAILEKTALSVDKFINYYKTDGACEEGPAYWDHAAGKMIEYLDLLSSITAGELDISQEEIIRNMGNYIRFTHIGEEYYVNFADASAKISAHPGIIYRYGEYIDDPALKGFAAAIVEDSSKKSWIIDGSLDRALHNVALVDQLTSYPPYREKEALVYYPDTQVMAARTEGGLFLAAKGGHNNESHNHNDVGSFILYYNTQPIFLDIGVETYSAKTFSKDRYSIWTMQSDYHNLPQVNGQSQQNGAEYKAAISTLSEGKRRVDYSIDIAPAYPADAHVQQWIRTYSLFTGRDYLVIQDSYELDQQLSPNQLNFMCAYAPDLSQPNKVLIPLPDGSIAALILPEGQFEVAVEEKILTDGQLLKAWSQDKLYKLSLTERKPELKGSWELELKMVKP